METEEKVNMVNCNTTLRIIKHHMVRFADTEEDVKSAPLIASILQTVLPVSIDILKSHGSSQTTSTPPPSPREMSGFIKTISDLVPLLQSSPSTTPSTMETCIKALESCSTFFRTNTGLIMSMKQTTASDLTTIAYCLHVNFNRGHSFLYKCHKSREMKFEDLYFYSKHVQAITMAALICAKEEKMLSPIMHVVDSQGAFIVSNGSGLNISHAVYSLGVLKYRGSRNERNRGKLGKAVEYNGGINKIFNDGPGAVANAIHGAGKIPHGIFPITGLFNRATQPDISRDLVVNSTPSEVSRVIGAMMTRGYDCQEYLKAVEEDSQRLIRSGNLHTISRTALGLSNMNRPAPTFFENVAYDSIPYFIEKGGTPTELASTMYALASARTANTDFGGVGVHSVIKHGIAVDALWNRLMEYDVMGRKFSDDTLRMMHMTYLIARSVDHYFPSTPSKGLAGEMVRAANMLVQRNFDWDGAPENPHIYLRHTMNVLGFVPVDDWRKIGTSDYEGKSRSSYVQDLIGNMAGTSDSYRHSPPFPYELAHYVNYETQTAVQFSTDPSYCHELIPPTKGYDIKERRETGMTRAQREVCRESGWSIVKISEESMIDHDIQRRHRRKYFKDRMIIEMQRRYETKLSYR